MVRVEKMDTARIGKALKEGRLYIAATEEESRMEVLNRIGRIACYASDAAQVNRTWQDLTASEERIRSFRYRQQEKGDVNPCRIAACVHHMLEKGLYRREACNLRVLCKAMYPEVDSESMRRNNTNYLTKEDIRIINNNI